MDGIISQSRKILSNIYNSTGKNRTKSAKAKAPQQMAKQMLIIKSTKRRVPKRRPGKVNTSIPAAIATRVVQNSQNRIHTETHREVIAPFVMNPNSQPGDNVIYDMNPARIIGSRLQKLALNYQQYRFRRLAITLQSPAPSTASGLYAVGYTRNPDQEIGTGIQAIQTITNMPGATTSTVWNTTTSHASLDAKWYNIDADSQEIMDTTQGLFAACVMVPPSTTSPVSFAVWLDYTVEFRGSATQRVPQFLGLFPAGTWTRVGTTTGATFVADSGEPPFPTTNLNVIYTVNPVWSIVDTNFSLVTIRAMVKTTSVNNPWVFYQSVEGAQTGDAISIPASFITERTILSAAP